MERALTGHDEPLDYGERWLLDCLTVLRPPVSVATVCVDMSHALRRLETCRRSGTPVTATHLLISTAARVLAANPAFHQVIAGGTRHNPGSVDIGISVSSDTFVAPVLVIEGAERKTVEAIAEETARRAVEAQDASRRMLATTRRWGWLLPFGVLRRMLQRRQFANPRFRRKIAGSFQISTVPVDWAMTTTLVAGGVLTAGRIAPRVVAINGHPAVRPTMHLTLSGDHGVWNGRSAARFLSAVQQELEAAPASAVAAAS